MNNQPLTSLLMFWWSLVVVVVSTLFGETFCAYSPVPQAFPQRWDGDKLNKSECQIAQSWPSWLKGMLFCQLAASYGDRQAPDGQRADHMLDAVAAMGVFDLDGQRQTSNFTGVYYPSHQYKIWQFDDRDMSKSGFAFNSFHSVMNVTAKRIWERVPSDALRDQPNFDFWKINRSVVAGGEMFSVGLTFNLNTSRDFRLFPFQEAGNQWLGQPLVPYHLPVHERVDPDTGLIWSTVLAADASAVPPTFRQVVFTVDAAGVRRIEGAYVYPTYDPNGCQGNTYVGDRSNMPRYAHGVTSTVNYLIIPLGSAYFDFCRVTAPGCATSPETLCDPKLRFKFPYDDRIPLTFLIFDKRNKQFLPPIASPSHGFVSHQFNAYERNDSSSIIVADMITYDNSTFDQYRVDHLLQPADRRSPPVSRVQRYEINVANRSISNHSLLPDNETLIEFPHFNRNLTGKPYKYGYVIVMPFYAGSRLLKLDLDTPSGVYNKQFVAGDNVALAEPNFVPRPNSTEEDDGVLILRGLDVSANRTRVYVLDAKTMQKIGEILAPILLPFGLHDRFYTKESLGMST